jgi:putative transposase
LPLPTPAQLREAFLWSEFRTVNTNAVVSLHNNRYQVDELLIGRKVELVFDPFDLARIDVRWSGRSMGAAVPKVIGRHAHPAARPEPGVEPPPPATGIDYLRLVEARADAELAQRTSYAGISGPGRDGGQLALPGTDRDQPELGDDPVDTGEVAR